MTDTRTYTGPPSPAPRGGPGGHGRLRLLGEVLLTLGLVLLLFVFYEVYVTNWFAAARQRDATHAMQDQWRNERGDGLGALDGKAFARLYIPALGPDYHFAVVQGTDRDALEIGPGHYKDTAMPGQPGNFAIAGHRVGKGAPFNDIDLLRSCDAMIVETGSDWFVYRMLPESGEAQGWAGGRGTAPECSGAHRGAPVQPLGGAYSGLPGQQIVAPSRSEVIDPIPGQADSALPPRSRAALITLTTCHPRFSDDKRLIVHGVLVKRYAKNGATGRPPELAETR